MSEARAGWHAPSIPGLALAVDAFDPAAVLGGQIVLALATAPPLLAPGAKPCRVILVQQRDRYDAWSLTERKVLGRCRLPAGGLPARVRRRIEQRAGRSSDRKRVR